ncbi:MAG: hypothetical protein CMN78_05395 [Spirochaetales bacterium]|nr:hypothetical protein [Spirochaetales bacterium]
MSPYKLKSWLFLIAACCVTVGVVCAGGKNEQIERIQQLFEEKEFQEAMAVLQEVLVEDPDRFDELQKFHEAYLAIQKAISELEEGIIEDIKKENPAGIYEKIGLISLLDPKPNEYRSAVLEDFRYEAGSIISNNQIASLMDQAFLLVSQQKYWEAIDLYLTGVGIGYELFETLEFGNIAKNQVKSSREQLAVSSSDFLAAEESLSSLVEINNEEFAQKNLQVLDQAVGDLSDQLINIVGFQGQVAFQESALQAVRSSLRDLREDRRDIYYLRYLDNLLNGRSEYEGEEGIRWSMHSIWRGTLENLDAQTRALLEDLSVLANQAFIAGDWVAAEKFYGDLLLYAPTAATVFALWPSVISVSPGFVFSEEEKNLLTDTGDSMVDARAAEILAQLHIDLIPAYERVEALLGVAVGDDADVLSAHRIDISSVLDVLDTMTGRAAEDGRYFSELAGSGLQTASEISQFSDLLASIGNNISLTSALDVEFARKIVDIEVSALTARLATISEDAKKADDLVLEVARILEKGEAPDEGTVTTLYSNPNLSLEIAAKTGNEIASLDDDAGVTISRLRNDKSEVLNDPGMIAGLQKGTALSEQIRKTMLDIDRIGSASSIYRDFIPGYLRSHAVRTSSSIFDIDQLSLARNDINVVLDIFEEAELDIAAEQEKLAALESEGIDVQLAGDQLSDMNDLLAKILSEMLFFDLQFATRISDLRIGVLSEIYTPIGENILAAEEFMSETVSMLRRRDPGDKDTVEPLESYPRESEILAITAADDLLELRNDAELTMEDLRTDKNEILENSSMVLSLSNGDLLIDYIDESLHDSNRIQRVVELYQDFVPVYLRSDAIRVLSPGLAVVELVERRGKIDNLVGSFKLVGEKTDREMSLLMRRGEDGENITIEKSQYDEILSFVQTNVSDLLELDVQMARRIAEMRIEALAEQYVAAADQVRRADEFVLDTAFTLGDRQPGDEAAAAALRSYPAAGRDIAESAQQDLASLLAATKTVMDVLQNDKLEILKDPGLMQRMARGEELIGEIESSLSAIDRIFTMTGLHRDVVPTYLRTDGIRNVQPGTDIAELMIKRHQIDEISGSLYKMLESVSENLDEYTILARGGLDTREANSQLTELGDFLTANLAGMTLFDIQFADRIANAKIGALAKQYVAAADRVQKADEFVLNTAFTLGDRQPGDEAAAAALQSYPMEGRDLAEGVQRDLTVLLADTNTVMGELQNDKPEVLKSPGVTQRLAVGEELIDKIDGSLVEVDRIFSMTGLHRDVVPVYLRTDEIRTVQPEADAPELMIKRRQLDEISRSFVIIREKVSTTLDQYGILAEGGVDTQEASKQLSELDDFLAANLTDMSLYDIQFAGRIAEAKIGDLADRFEPIDGQVEEAKTLVEGIAVTLEGEELSEAETVAVLNKFPDESRRLAVDARGKLTVLDDEARGTMGALRTDKDTVLRDPGVTGRLSLGDALLTCMDESAQEIARILALAAEEIALAEQYREETFAFLDDAADSLDAEKVGDARALITAAVRSMAISLSHQKKDDFQAEVDRRTGC